MSRNIPARYQYDPQTHRYWDTIAKIWIPVDFFADFHKNIDYNINK